ncbi:hypothetical protein HDU98_008906 [Podochytrium sp. JEL0797]|nr:hypothetical protein HDU98_008906 [Podochytrium sp. JEL0797]
MSFLFRIPKSIQESVASAEVANTSQPVRETLFGFINDPMDAMLMVQACIREILTSLDTASTAYAQRNCDCVQGKFLNVFGEVEPAAGAPEPRKTRPTHFLDSRIPGLEPTYSSKTLKQNARLVPNGLTKRTITLKGSDGHRHRMISYYAREDVIQMYSTSSGAASSFKTPSETPELNALLNNPSIDLKALLAESVDLEKYASEFVVAKKQRKDDSLRKAVAQSALVDSSEPHQGSNHFSTLHRLKKRKPSAGTVLTDRPASAERLAAEANGHAPSVKHGHVRLDGGPSSYGEPERYYLQPHQASVASAEVANKSQPVRETFFGFINDPMDAMLMVEACIRGILTSLDTAPSDMSEIMSTRSGTVVVYKESSKRWRVWF